MESGDGLQNLNCNIFPKILIAEKPIKGHKHQREKGELHRVFIVYFLISNFFVLPPHGRLNLFG